MGFPRILSKNNKIYTKLGEFCLSCDGNQFYIVCHTCQQELQTQDTFWKHIQDEHSFMHHLKQENQSEPNKCHPSYMDGAGVAPVDVPPPAASLVPHYRKPNDKVEHGGVMVEYGEDDEEHQPKDYTEMRVIEPSAVEVDIKVEQHDMAGNTIYMPPGATNHVVAAPGVPMPHQPMKYDNMLPQVGGPNMGVPMPTPVPQLLALHEIPKDSSSATSEDGERWYICDYETCGLKFKYQSRLELHRSVHSKVRRFACELCTASFKQSCNLSTHRKKKHNIKSSKF